MTLTKIPAPTDPNVHGRTLRRDRARIVATTTAVVVGLWTALTTATDYTVLGPSFDGSAPRDIGVAPVLIATFVSTLAGWGVLELIERRSTRPRNYWTKAAIGFTAISVLSPLSGTGVSASDRVALVALHLLVAVLFIGQMRATLVHENHAQQERHGSDVLSASQHS